MREGGYGRRCAVALALTVGCSAGTGGTTDSVFDTIGGASATSGGSTGGAGSGAGQTSTDGGSGGSGVVDGSGGPAGSSGGSSDGGGSTTAVGPEATCGDGQRDPGEQCDDGNDSDLDDCTTQCTVSTCTDGLHSGAETDVDCGGPCQACGLCEACLVDGDCEAGTQCSDGACNFTVQVEVDWAADCTTDGTSAVITPGLPAATLRATAVMSAGSVWDPPYSPPTNGWGYIPECDGWTVQSLRTPAGTWYATPEEAFANLGATTEDFVFAGGDFICHRNDSNCLDNHGSVIFDLSAVCDSP